MTRAPGDCGWSAVDGQSLPSVSGGPAPFPGSPCLRLARAQAPSRCGFGATTCRAASVSEPMTGCVACLGRQRDCHRHKGLGAGGGRRQAQRLHSTRSPSLCEPWPRARVTLANALRGLRGKGKRPDPWQGSQASAFQWPLQQHGPVRCCGAPRQPPGPPGVPWPDRADQHPSRTVKPTAAPSQGTVSCVGTWGAQGKWMQGLAHAQLNSSHPP